MSVLLPKMRPYLYQNGGPIIMVQVLSENQMNPSINAYTALADTPWVLGGCVTGIS